MSDWQELERVLLARGVSEAELGRLRSVVQPIVVHSNQGVVAATINGPIAIGNGAVANAAPRAPDVPPTPSAAPASAAPTAESRKRFWEQAGQLASGASSATVAVSKIVELAAKLF
jgi:hypothetical protein